MKKINWISKIHTSSGDPVITREKISRLDDDTPDSFIRIHRSFIINTGKIDSYNKANLSQKNRKIIKNHASYSMMPFFRCMVQKISGRRSGQNVTALWC